MGIWNRFFGCKDNNKKQEPIQFSENERPDTQTERIIEWMGSIPSGSGSTSCFDSERQ